MAAGLRGVDGLRGGLSLAVAPEGTRGALGEIGEFKKGAFRIAMEAGVPITPIFIHNAGDVLPRGAWLMRSACVRVTVMDPIPTHDWKLENLDDEISHVRSLYVDAIRKSDPVR